eukprot:COSAG01_NODE_15453_length_1336_cov_1.812449_2_plen_143_part_00
MAVGRVHVLVNCAGVVGPAEVRVSQSLRAKPRRRSTDGGICTPRRLIWHGVRQRALTEEGMELTFATNALGGCDQPLPPPMTRWAAELGVCVVWRTGLLAAPELMARSLLRVLSQASADDDAAGTAGGPLGRGSGTSASDSS